MPLLPIVRLGHPALRDVAMALDPGGIGDSGVQALIDSMIETMRAARGVGLAAPQVGISLQIFVYEQAPPPPPAAPAAGAGGAMDAGAAEPASPAAAAAPDAGGATEAAAPDALPAIPLRTVINPMLTPQAGELVYDWEGCLSIPDLRGLVPRHPAVRVRCLDREGRPLDYVAHGLEARIIQHEFDHLNGVVFLDRMRDLKTLACREEWERYMAPGAAADDSDVVDDGEGSSPPPADDGSPPSGNPADSADPAVAGSPPHPTVAAAPAATVTDAPAAPAGREAI
jgi:peptide deformylase